MGMKRKKEKAGKGICLTMCFTIYFIYVRIHYVLSLNQGRKKVEYTLHENSGLL